MPASLRFPSEEMPLNEWEALKPECFKSCYYVTQCTFFSQVPHEYYGSKRAWSMVQLCVASWWNWADRPFRFGMNWRPYKFGECTRMSANPITGGHTMTNYWEILRLTDLRILKQDIAKACRYSRNTVANIIKVTEGKGLKWSATILFKIRTQLSFQGIPWEKNGIVE